jgi:hypothetical protein
VPIVGAAQVPFRDVVEPSLYGRSTVEFTAALSLGASSSSGKQILLTSPQRDAVGAGFIDFPASVTTTADGTVKFKLTTDDLYDATIALPHHARGHVPPTRPCRPSSTSGRSNFAMGAGALKTALGAGPSATTTWSNDCADVAARPRLLPSAYAGVRGDLLASGAFSDAYAVAAARHDDFLINVAQVAPGADAALQPAVDELLVDQRLSDERWFLIACTSRRCS